MMRSFSRASAYRVESKPTMTTTTMTTTMTTTKLTIPTTKTTPTTMQMTSDNEFRDCDDEVVTTSVDVEESDEISGDNDTGFEEQI
jgi:hypothetical protein